MTTTPENPSPESVRDNVPSAPADVAETTQQRQKVKQRLYPQLAEIPEFIPAPKPPEPPEGATAGGVAPAETAVPEDAPSDTASSLETTATATPAPIEAVDDLSTSFVEDCQAALGYVFNDEKLLRQALTHASIANVRLDSNERFEFLGDSIMGCVICEYLFKSFPSLEEGELTRIKSSVVSRHTCAKIAADLKLERFLFLGKGLAIHERIPASIMAAAFEALVAAVFLDGGWDAAREFVIRILKNDISKVSTTTHGENYKSQLQQQSQKVFSQTPTYKLLGEKGPDHSKSFQIAATIGGNAYPAAWGASKKEAEQIAARNALDVINNVIADPNATPAVADTAQEADNAETGTNPGVVTPDVVPYVDSSESSQIADTTARPNTASDRVAVPDEPADSPIESAPEMPISE